MWLLISGHGNLSFGDVLSKSYIWDIKHVDPDVELDEYIGIESLDSNKQKLETPPPPGGIIFKKYFINIQVDA